MDSYLTPKQFADLTGISRGTVYRYCKEGKLLHIKYNRIILIPGNQLEAKRFYDPLKEAKAYVFGK